MPKPATPNSPVPNVHTFKQSTSATPDEREKTQKPLSFIQLTTQDPTPIAAAKYAMLNPKASLVNPIAEKIPAEVIIAVVLEP